MSKTLTAEQYEQKLTFEKWLKDNDLEVPKPDGWNVEYSAKDDAIIYRRISEGMSREPLGFAYLLSRSALARFRGVQGALHLRIVLNAERTRAINRRAGG